MKVRIIERNDGKFQYEFGHIDQFGTGLMIWDRAEYMTFGTEEEARHHALDIIKFISAVDTKRVVEEIEV